MIYQYINYREVLKNKLSEKGQQNSAYSMRAFARDLGVAPSMLVDVLGGKKHLSRGRAHLIASRLGLSQKEAEYFGLLVEAEGPDARKSPELKNMLLEKIQTFRPNRGVRDLTVDAFRVISDWYHLVLIELAELDGFNLTAESASRVLEISKTDIELAIDRLLRLELLERLENGRLGKKEGRWLVDSTVSNSALRKFHKQMLEKAGDSLETQTPQEKIVGSETFALDPALLPRARELTDKYFDSMLALSKGSKMKSRVYHLGVQCFGVTPVLKKKSSGGKK